MAGPKQTFWQKHPGFDLYSLFWLIVFLVLAALGRFYLPLLIPALVVLIYLIFRLLSKNQLWVLNGYVQGMGVPPCASLMARWIRPSELATKQSIWNASHSIGAGIVVALCGALISKY